jgi:ribosome biogenesis GTPase A
MSVIGQSTERRIEHQYSIESALRTLLTNVDLVTSNRSLREKLLSLERKLASDQLNLAVLGQMKRGKSSFINALLGADILPTGVLPATAVITQIKYGPVPGAVILYTTGAREIVDLNALAEYITEAGNPANRKQVASAEIAYPSPFLKSGIALIDTPGIGSTYVQNTRTTEGYLENVDAGIVVLSVDPPITEIESHFLRNAKEDIPKLFFILNKIDLASAEDVSHISRFLGDQLGGLQLESAEIFCLSARRALQEKLQAAGTVAPSGMEIFEQRLQGFLAEEKGGVLIRSIALDALHIARTLKFAAAIGVRTQSMSPEELEGKRTALGQLLAQTATELRELQVLLGQHGADCIAGVERDLTAQVKKSVPIVRENLERFQALHFRETGRVFGALLEDFLRQEVEAVFRHWRMREDEEMQARLDILSARFVAQANAILERLHQAAGILFEVPTEPLSITCPLRMDSRLSYKVERIFGSLDSFLLLLPGFLQRPMVLKRMNDRIWQLLDMNAGRIRYDYVERLQSSMAHFEKDLSAAITIAGESLASVLHEPHDLAPRGAAIVEVLDAVIRDCEQVLQ